MKKILSLVICLLIGGFLSAQHMSVERFRWLDRTILTGKNIVEDINNQVCAVVIINTTEQGFVFSGCNIEKTEQKIGEIWLFISPGSKFLNIMHRTLGTIRNYEFPQRLEPKNVYEITLRTAKIKQVVEESITDQYLIIESSTPDAKIYINNEYIGRNEASKLLPIFEEHSYRVEAPLYHSKEGFVKLNFEKSTKLKIDLDTAFGYLTINTLPLQGAEIEINGELQKLKTPFTTKALASGIYNVQAFLPMYKTNTVQVQVKDGKNTEVNIELKPDFALAEINCLDKDVEIYIDGEHKSKGNFKENLSEGVHRVELKKASHREIRKNIQIIAGQNYYEEIDSLQSINGKLDINTTPINARLFIDDKEYGETPIRISKILIGNHNVSITKDGYETLYEKIFIEEGKMATYSFELKELSPEKKEKIAQERITIKETPAPIKEEPKMKHRSKGGFSLNAGFDLGFNVNAGMKATLKTKKMKRLGFIVTADFIYSYPSSSELKEARNYAQEINNSFGYEVYQITLPKTIDLPIMIGLSLEAISKSKFQLLIEGEAGLNIRKYSNRIDKITLNGETEKRITTYPFSSGIASQVGIVAKFQERLSIGLHAYILGGENQENNSSTRLNPLIKIGYNF